jgi:hypothetical protein
MIEYRKVISKTKDHSEGRHCQPEFVQSDGHWNISQLHVFLSRTNQKAQKLARVKLALLEGYRLELRNFVHRIGLRSEKPHQPFLLRLVLLCYKLDTFG